jgi:hypothetical protein
LRVITLSKLGNRDDEQFLAGMATAQKTMNNANNEFNQNGLHRTFGVCSSAAVSP